MEFSELAARERLGWVFRRLGTAASTRPTPCYKPSGRLPPPGARGKPSLPAGDAQCTVNYHHATALSRRRSLDILKPEAHPPGAVLDHDDLHFPILEDSANGLAAVLPAGPRCLHGFHLKTALG